MTTDLCWVLMDFRRHLGDMLATVADFHTVYKDDPDFDHDRAEWTQERIALGKKELRRLDGRIARAKKKEKETA